ncbi:hypothetical protein BJX76DRAFT_353286 [Aspergillus varians]
MAYPNHREMDVARSLLDMAQIPGATQDLTADTYIQNNQPRRTRRHNQRGGQFQQANSPNHANSANLHPYYPYTPSHLPTQTVNPISCPYQPFAPAHTDSRNQSLQDHLIRQQILAGIAPEDIVTIDRNRNPHGNANGQGIPALLQITNHGVSAPYIPPATFTPQPPYSIPQQHVKTERAPAGQYLTIPEGRPGSHNPTYEPPPPLFSESVAGSGFSLFGPQGYRPGNPVGQFLPHIAQDAQGSQYAQGSQDAQGSRYAPSSRYGLGDHSADGAYVPQGYSDRPTSTFNSSKTDYDSDAHQLVKNEPNQTQEQRPTLGYPTYGFNGGQNDQTTSYGYGSNKFVKDELDGGQEQRYMLGDLALTFDGTSNGHTSVFQDFEFNYQPEAGQPYPTERTPSLHEHQGYETINTRDGRGAARATEDNNGLQFIPWSPLQQRQTPISKRRPNASRPAKTPIKEEIIPGYREPFNILLAIIDRPEISMLFTKELRVCDLVSLQATSRAFRLYFVRNLPRIVRIQAMSRLRTASRIFPWRCYQKLWVQRVVEKDEMLPYSDVYPPKSSVMYIASLRWLQMVRYRDNTVCSILTNLKKAGYGFPSRYKSSIFKLWFLMDIPDMRRRMWTIQNRNLWTDLDLFMATFFIIRIDMYVKTERGNPTGGQRRLIMAQPSLKFLLNVLTGQSLKDYMELFEATIRWRHHPSLVEIVSEGFFGISWAEVGSLQYEGYGQGRAQNAKLKRPDEIILGEVERRKLNVREMYERIFAFADPESFMKCERPNSFWDQEMEIASSGSNVVLNDVLRLD